MELDSDGGKPPSVIDLSKVFSSVKENEFKFVVGSPFVGQILDSHAAEKFHHCFPRVQFASPDNFIFQTLADFTEHRNAFNQDVSERSKRLTLSKIQKNPASSSFLVDPSIFEDRVVLKLKFKGFDSTNSRARSELDKQKNALIDFLFALDPLSGLKDSFDECKLVTPSLDKPQIHDKDVLFVHLRACSAEALKQFNRVSTVIRDAPPSATFQQRSVLVQECFVPKLNKPVFVPPPVKCVLYRVCFSVALAPSNLDLFESLLTGLLGAPVTPRVVMGHPVFSPAGPCFFITLSLLETEVERALTCLYSHLRSDDLAPSVEKSLHLSKLRDFYCITCGHPGHHYNSCPRILRAVSHKAAAPASQPGSAVLVGSGAASDEPCRDFRRKQCERGDSCRFSHSLPQPVRPVSILRSAVRAPGSAPSRSAPAASVSSHNDASAPASLFSSSVASVSSFASVVADDAAGAHRPLLPPLVVSSSSSSSSASSSSSPSSSAASTFASSSSASPLSSSTSRTQPSTPTSSFKTASHVVITDSRIPELQVLAEIAAGVSSSSVSAPSGVQSSLLVDASSLVNNNNDAFFSSSDSFDSSSRHSSAIVTRPARSSSGDRSDSRPKRKLADDSEPIDSRVILKTPKKAVKLGSQSVRSDHAMSSNDVVVLPVGVCDPGIVDGTPLVDALPLSDTVMVPANSSTAEVLDPVELMIDNELQLRKSSSSAQPLQQKLQQEPQQQQLLISDSACAQTREDRAEPSPLGNERQESVQSNQFIDGRSQADSSLTGCDVQGVVLGPRDLAPESASDRSGGKPAGLDLEVSDCCAPLTDRLDSGLNLTGECSGRQVVSQPQILQQQQSSYNKPANDSDTELEQLSLELPALFPLSALATSSSQHDHVSDALVPSSLEPFYSEGPSQALHETRSSTIPASHTPSSADPATSSVIHLGRISAASSVQDQVQEKAEEKEEYENEENHQKELVVNEDDSQSNDVFE
jgi:hypothetical protein